MNAGVQSFLPDARCFFLGLSAFWPEIDILDQNPGSEAAILPTKGIFCNKISFSSVYKQESA